MSPNTILEQGSEFEALKAQLLQAQKLSSVGAIASSVAHEFNNILTSLLNYTKLAMKSQDEDFRNQALDKILKSSQRAATIVNSMLGFARKSSVKKEPVSLAKLLDEVLVLTEKDLHKHQIKLNKIIHDEPTAPVVAVHIEQVLLNLIINARQAMKSGGTLKVELKTCPEQEVAEIIVSDTGHGIQPDNLRKIFDPFFTTKDPDNNNQGGTGLGLSVCRQIIENHHGRMRVESILGKGTTFIIKLPLKAEEETQNTFAETLKTL
ncbi:MAG: sensor histidine kinase [Gemmataceae bacterium]